MKIVAHGRTKWKNLIELNEGTCYNYIYGDTYKLIKIYIENIILIKLLEVLGPIFTRARIQSVSF